MKENVVAVTRGLGGSLAWPGLLRKLDRLNPAMPIDGAIQRVNHRDTENTEKDTESGGIDSMDRMPARIRPS